MRFFQRGRVSSTTSLTASSISIVECSRFWVPFPLGEPLKPPDGIGAVIYRFFHVLKSSPDVLVFDLRQNELNVSENRHQKIVEIMRNASSHRTEGRKLFGLDDFV